MNCSSCRVRGAEKLTYRHAELKVKVKKYRNVQACSLFSSLFLVKGKRKTHSSFFLFNVTNSPGQFIPSISIEEGK